jgi:hypothetical protein
LLGISLNILAPAKIRLDGKARRTALHCARRNASGMAARLAATYMPSRQTAAASVSTCRRAPR